MPGLSRTPERCATLERLREDRGTSRSLRHAGAPNVNDLPTSILLSSILVLVVMSAYFSGSETAMMALNRYRLRHLVREGHRGAQKANRLLQRRDRLITLILIGNNLVNFLAASVATVIGIRLLGDTLGPLVAAVVLTLVFLVFAEVTPKNFAQYRPETLAFPSSHLLQPLLKVLHPLVSVINAITNYVASPVMQRTPTESDELSAEQLRTVVHELSAIPLDRQDMLLRILDLEKAVVEDIMVPKAEIVGIDVNEDTAGIVASIISSQHTRLPVFRENIDDVVGILHLRRASRFLAGEEFTKADLIQETEEPYFVPEGTPLPVQLIHFKNERQRIGLVVDEYGDIQGLVTLEDILEEVVGEFTTDFAAQLPEVHPQDDGSYIIEGAALLRDVNRMLAWELPIAGPRTINGLVLEHLEFIPDANVCLRIDGYLVETLQIIDNVVRTVKVTPGT